MSRGKDSTLITADIFNMRLKILYTLNVFVLYLLCDLNFVLIYKLAYYSKSLKFDMFLNITLGTC